MNELTSKDYWASSKRESNGNVKDLVFSKIFRKHIPKAGNSKEVALEIGCVPGQFLAYICKNFGYFPEGIDYEEGTEKVTSETLRNNGLLNYKLYEADFLKWKAKKKYDLVCSFGFIEHFKDPVDVVKKHLDILKDGGTLLIEVPNFNGLRYFVSKHSDDDTLNLHNMDVMDLKFYKLMAKKFNLKIRYLGYCGGFEYNWGNKHPSLREKFTYAPFKLASKVLKKIPSHNKMFSSYIVFIAEKKPEVKTA